MKRAVLACLLLAARSSFAEIHHAQGELAGEVTRSSVLLQSRLTATSGPVLDETGDIPGKAGEACFEWSESEDFAGAKRTDWLPAVAEHDFVVRLRLDGLKAGTRYHYRLVFGENRDQTQTGPVRSFKTLPEKGTLSFCMGSCMNYHAFMHGKANGGGPVTATEEDKRLGYPVFAAMTALKPDFFIGTGDIVYYDHPAKPAAQTLPELRRKWHEQFRFPRLIEFFARTPAYWSKDDHDFRFNDADLGGQKLPEPATGIEIFREQMPVFDLWDKTTPTYRTHRVHPHVQLWFTEGRDYRSPNKMPDGPEKSIWGKGQREWLQSTLKASDAAWKIIITPTPMVGPDRNSKVDNHTNLAGFKHEADSFFQWLRENGVKNVLTFCGDRHWQYHSVHPLGVEEFSVGALNDENAIRGEKPGGPKTTDPEGKIKQPYIYKEPTGGFLRVTVDDEAKLVLEHRDDHGVVLNTVEKTAK
ncbi:MAG: alkaline phosphatase D family protein [Verrucomicrobiaceae bacterium]|nr:alkaline phosphatase D family protein [Verrucomicrobiaceae bacterium]